MNDMIFITGFFICILLIWNIIERKKIRASTAPISTPELNARFNFITAFGAFLVLAIGYLGLNDQKKVTDRIYSEIKPKADSLITNVGRQVQSLDSSLANKNILKAGIYIVSDLKFRGDSLYKFSSLRTIDNKSLPQFKTAPKILISTKEGFTVPIKFITDSSFEFYRPYGFLLAEEGNYKRPETATLTKIDLWIADYKTEK
ncbi:MAG: hypothetical protein EYC69_11910 [Bacteroidetes bacterium]|nr:MAG: hypothetical protein EYC69_11910 [Bacteroidota bacterium]